MASKTSCVSPDLQFLRTKWAKNIWDKKNETCHSFMVQCTKIDSFFLLILTYFRAVARSENPGGLVVMGGDNVPTLVEIG